jgi:DDE superfamily endonuclease
MEDILDLYAKPYNPLQPVLCFDEKSKQLLQDTRPVKNTKEGKPRRRDYEYERNGTRNIFVTVEPKGGHREVTVTKQRKKPDFAAEMKRIIELPRYERATNIHIVLDNLNTHFEKSFTETFGEEETGRIMSRIQFHYTPKHASWLNMAEIEIGILSRQSIRGRIPTEEKLVEKAGLWQERRNGKQATINWKFTVKDARVKFKYEPTELS